MFHLKDVFGIRASQVASYTERSNVDGRFEEALNGDHHIVVYGSSKQGKTSLRLKHLNDSRCVVVRCGPKMGVEDLYMSIIRQEGVMIDVYDTSTVSGKFGTKVKLAYKARLPFMSNNEEEEETETNATSRVRRSNYIAFNLGEAQSIGEILTGLKFQKFVVLENFHYLAREAQQDVARDLKTFHEMGIRFIILGIWRESNMIMIHNPDLQDRMTEIPVEPWYKDDFDKVIRVGCECLNIRIIGDVLARFKHEAFGNIGMLQEFLRLYCEINEITATQGRRVHLVSNEKASEVFRRKLIDQRDQFSRCLEVIASKSRMEHKDPLLLPYYLVRVLCKLSVEELQEGIPKQRLLECVRGMHHREDKDTVRSADITYLLKSLPQIQMELGTPLLYYDSSTRRIRFVDTRHFFVINRADREEILSDIPNPAEGLARRKSDQTELLIPSESDDGTIEARNVLGSSTDRGESGDERLFDEDWGSPAEVDESEEAAGRGDEDEYE